MEMVWCEYCKWWQAMYPFQKLMKNTLISLDFVFLVYQCCGKWWYQEEFIDESHNQLLIWFHFSLIRFVFLRRKSKNATMEQLVFVKFEFARNFRRGESNKFDQSRPRLEYCQNMNFSSNLTAVSSNLIIRSGESKICCFVGIRHQASTLSGSMIMSGH